MTPHEKLWPDKVMFAALLAIVAGALTVFFALLRVFGATLDDEQLPRIFLEYPAQLSLWLGVFTIVLGIVSWRYQAAVWSFLAALTSIAAMGFLGIGPVLGLFALGSLVLSKLDGEETTHDEHIFERGLWPDKALAASMFILVTGVVAAFQSAAIFMDRWEVETIAPDTPWVMASFDAVVAAWCLFAMVQVFRLRRAWTGWVAGVGGVLTFGFVLLGPVFGAVTLLLLYLAHRENEFSATRTAGST